MKSSTATQKREHTHNPNSHLDRVIYSQNLNITKLEKRLNIGNGPEPVKSQIICCDVQNVPITSPRSSLPGSLLKANLYSRLISNLASDVDEIPSPQSLSRFASQTGVQSLLDRMIVTSNFDVSPILHDKQFLRPLKARLFPIEYRTERGMIFEQPNRVYLPALHLQPKSDTFRTDDLRANIILPASINSEGSDKLDLMDGGEIEVINPSYSFGWILHIRSAKLESGREAYASFFDKVCELNIQTAACWVIREIEKMAKIYTIPLVIIRCDALIKISLGPLPYPLQHNLLMSCVYNHISVAALIQKPGQKFKNGLSGRIIAASTIQFYYNEYRTRVQREKADLEHRAKRKITAIFKSIKVRKSYLKKAKARMANDRVVFDKIQDNYINQAKDFYTSKRVLVYICPQERFEESFCQLERAYPIMMHPEVTVVLVLHVEPVNLNEQILRVFDCEHAGDPIKAGKLHIIISEISPHLSKNASEGAALYFSTKAMKQLQTICKKMYPIVLAKTMNQYVASICKELNCPFYGSPSSIAQAVNDNPMELYSWLQSAFFDVMPTYYLKRSYCQKDINEKIMEIKSKALDIKLWMFKKYNRFGNLALNDVTFDSTNLGKKDNNGEICNSNIFWIFGGILNALPSASNYRLVQVGVQMNLNQTWQVLATTDTDIINYVEYGKTVPQQSIENRVLKDLLEAITAMLRERQFTGYLTILMYVWENSGKQVIKISSLVPYLNRAIINAVSFVTRHRLIMDSNSLQFSIDDSAPPWKLSFLGTNLNCDATRVKNDFKIMLPENKMRVVYFYEKLEHDIFDHCRNLCSITLQRRGLSFDQWSVEGIEFLPSKSKYPIICVAESPLKVYEMYLACLAQIEVFADESDYPFQQNLHLTALKVLREIRNYRHIHGLSELIFDDLQFENPEISLLQLLTPLINHRYLPIGAFIRSAVEAISRKGMSSETTKLLGEDIASVIACQIDPSLKNPVPVRKRAVSKIK